MVTPGCDQTVLQTQTLADVPNQSPTQHPSHRQQPARTTGGPGWAGEGEVTTAVLTLSQHEHKPVKLLSFQTVIVVGIPALALPNLVWPVR